MMPSGQPPLEERAEPLYVMKRRRTAGLPNIRLHPAAGAHRPAVEEMASTEEMNGKYLRVILLSDGETVHNAFFDRSFAP
jgi:hypothetical protein